jgi:hypothetical protein
MNELETGWKEVVMAHSSLYPSICLNGLRQSTILHVPPLEGGHHTNPFVCHMSQREGATQRRLLA